MKVKKTIKKEDKFKKFSLRITFESSDEVDALSSLLSSNITAVNVAYGLNSDRLMSEDGWKSEQYLLQSLMCEIPLHI